jgi:hypothetical protein
MLKVSEQDGTKHSASFNCITDDQSEFLKLLD